MGADFKKRVRDYIDREYLLADVSAVVVGLSGGADSVCLFNILSDISTETGITVIPVHVHHGMRGEEADRDAAFSCRVAGNRGTVCEVARVDVPAYAAERGLSTEEAARILRYRELERIREEKKAGCIALAHHHPFFQVPLCIPDNRSASPYGSGSYTVHDPRQVCP